MKRKLLKFGHGFRVVVGNNRSQAAQMTLAPGECEGDALNRHVGADQWVFVLAGRGEAIVNRKKYGLKAGALLLIEHGDRHEIRNIGSSYLKTLSIYVPPAYDAAGEELAAGKSKRR